METSVLAIDTDPDGLRATAGLLEQAGFDVLSASTFQQVHAAIGRETPPVVVVEPVMDGIDGYELCRAIRKVFPGYEPAIFVASRHVRGDGPASKTAEVGGRMFLERPTMDDLLVHEVSVSIDKATAAARDAALVPAGETRVEVQEAEPTAVVAARDGASARHPGAWQYMVGLVVMAVVGAGAGAWLVSQMPSSGDGETAAAAGEAEPSPEPTWLEEPPQSPVDPDEPAARGAIPQPTANGIALLRAGPRPEARPAPEPAPVAEPPADAAAPVEVEAPVEDGPPAEAGTVSAAQPAEVPEDTGQETPVEAPGPAPSLVLDRSVPVRTEPSPATPRADPEPEPEAAANDDPPAGEPGVVASAPAPVEPPRLIASSRVEPRYPAAARRLRIGGTVWLRARIDLDGKVDNVEIIDDPGRRLGLGRAAAAAVREWRYEPAMRGNEPVEATIDVEIAFVP